MRRERFSSKSIDHPSPYVLNPSAMKYIILIIALGALFQYQQWADKTETVPQSTEVASTSQHSNSQSNRISSVTGTELVEYAQLFYGVPYLYGSSDPEAGFDCSGFINHVYSHFGIEVPRSSADFTNLGEPVKVEKAAPGDLILFTGTDLESGIVGHIGIVTSNDQAGLEFIHSSSGKDYSVTTSLLEGYYESRFVKVIRVV